jgi:hypothetical protein
MEEEIGAEIKVFSEEETEPLFIRTQVGADRFRICSLGDVADDPIEQKARALLKGASLSILLPSEINAIVSWLVDFRNDQICEGNGNGAEIADILLEKIQQMKLSGLKESLREDRERDIILRLNEAKASFADMAIRYSDARSCVLAENDAHLQNLEQRHREEKEAFDHLWQSPEKARAYSHASNQLMMLRAQSILLLQARRYDDQRKVMRISGVLERDETEERHRTMTKEYGNQKRLLEERQKHELEHIKMANEARLALIDRSEEKELAATSRRIMHIERELEEVKDCEKVWNVLGRNERLHAMQEMPRIRAATMTRAGTRAKMSSICGLKLPPLKILGEGRSRSGHATHAKRRRGTGQKRNQKHKIFGI